MKLNCTYIFIICLLNGIPKISFCQEKMSFGIRYGAGTSNIFAENFDNRNPAGIRTKTLIGNTLGFTYEIHSDITSNKPNIIFDLSLTEKGWREDLNITTYTNQLEYFQLSILSKILIRKKQLNPYLLAGIYGAYRRSFTKDPFIENRTYEVFESDPKGDFGIVVGGGIEYKLSRFLFSADAKYIFGFQSILQDSNPTSPGFLQNSQIVGTIGIAYRIFKKGEWKILESKRSSRSKKKKEELETPKIKLTE